MFALHSRSMAGLRRRWERQGTAGLSLEDAFPADVRATLKDDQPLQLDQLMPLHSRSMAGLRRRSTTDAELVPEASCIPGR